MWMAELVKPHEAMICLYSSLWSCELYVGQTGIVCSGKEACEDGSNRQITLVIHTHKNEPCHKICQCTLMAVVPDNSSGQMTGKRAGWPKAKHTVLSTGPR